MRGPGERHLSQHGQSFYVLLSGSAQTSSPAEGFDAELKSDDLLGNSGEKNTYSNAIMLSNTFQGCSCVFSAGRLVLPSLSRTSAENKLEQQFTELASHLVGDHITSRRGAEPQALRREIPIIRRDFL